MLNFERTCYFDSVVLTGTNKVYSIRCKCLLLIITVFAISSLGTHCTSQLFPSCVWRTHNPSAGRLDVVEQSSIFISSASWHSLGVLIHTFIHAPLVCIVSSHQIAIVLLCPGGRAGRLCRYGQHCPPGGNIAHCTRYIVVLKC